MVIDYLKQPGLIQNNLLPDTYLTLQQAERLRMMERYNELMQFLFPVLEKDIYNPSILIYMAYALDGIGMKVKSLNCAEKACFCNQNYCYGLAELGSEMLAENGLSSAEEYFVRAYKENPAMVHSQFIFARALQKAGRYNEALTYFNSFRSYYGPLPVDFYMGETHMLQGDDNKALQYYNSGLRELTEDPFLWVRFGDRSVIENVIRFYERNGFDSRAVELRIALETGKKYYPDSWTAQ
jgi:tetratricopeptide (TPR) repeat protein